MECIFESDISVPISNTNFKGYQSTFSDFDENLKRDSSTPGPVSHDIFHSMQIYNFVSPIILLLYTQVKVDLERLPVEQIWPELMGIILAVNAWMVPFLTKFGVEKGNGLSSFSIIIDSPHAISELVKEYFKIKTSDRRGCSTRTVDDDDKDVEEVYYDGPSVGSCAYNTAGVVKKHFQMIKRSEV